MDILQVNPMKKYSQKDVVRLTGIKVRNLVQWKDKKTFIRPLRKEDVTKVRARYYNARNLIKAFIVMQLGKHPELAGRSQSGFECLKLDKLINSILDCGSSCVYFRVESTWQRYKTKPINRIPIDRLSITYILTKAKALTASDQGYCCFRVELV